MAADTSFLWLRPATEMENLLDCANRKGLFVTVYGLTLRSSVPLTDNHIKETLHHLFRKVPSLRMCFRTRQDVLWACDMNHEQLDFQVTETREVVAGMEELLQYRFPTTEGPLWCARLLPDGAIGRCSRPDLAPDFPHTRILLLANHHGIADGTTNLLVTNTFLSLLDDVVANKPIDDSIQLGRLAAGEETEALLTAKMQELKKDEASFQQLLKDIKMSQQKKKLVPRAYPMTTDPNFKPLIVLRDLDKEATQSFIRRCKKEGVTVNSGLAAVTNVSIVDFVREGGVEQDFYHIQELHTVNLRRYWSGDTSGTLGVHMMASEKVNSTPAKWRDTFWEYARDVHKNMKHGLQDKDALMYVVPLMGEENIEDHFAERPPPECDYGLANMGNIDPLIPTEGKITRLSNLDRVTSCFNDPFYFMCHTLRGCFINSLTYANDILTRETAKNLMDKIFDNLVTVTQF